MATIYFTGSISGDMSVSGNYEGSPTISANDVVVFRPGNVDVTAGPGVALSAMYVPPTYTGSIGPGGSAVTIDCSGTGDEIMSIQGRGAEYNIIVNATMTDSGSGDEDQSYITVAIPQSSTCSLAGVSSEKTVRLVVCESGKTTIGQYLVPSGLRVLGGEVTVNDSSTALADAKVTAGTLKLKRSATSVELRQNTRGELHNAETIATLIQSSGSRFMHYGSGNITTAEVETGGIFDPSQARESFTITTLRRYVGSIVGRQTAAGLVTITNDIVIGSGSGVNGAGFPAPL